MRDILGLTFSGDRESYAWTCEVTLPDEESYNVFVPGKRLTLSVGGHPVSILLESRTRKRQSGTVEYTATGRTLTCLLDAPWATPVTRTWGTVTASQAAAELCALAGLSCSWEVCDWVLPAGRLAATAESPASILARLATACGAMVQPTLAGGVRVRYRYPVGVNELAAAAPVATLSLDTSVVVVSEAFEGHPGYSAVTVVDDRAATEAYLVMETDSDRNGSRSTFPPGEPCYVRVYHEAAYTMRATSGWLELVAVGETESLTATVSFDDKDTADLDKLVAGINSVTWYGNNLGSLAPNGGAQVILPGGSGFGVALVAYTTRYDVWRYTPANLGDSFSTQIECALADTSLAADTSGGVRLTVRRGQGASPCPDELSAALACSLAPATQAGRNYLDQYGQNVLAVELESWPADGDVLPLPGDVAAVLDSEADGLWHGTVTAISLAVAVQDAGGALVTQTTTLERPIL